MLKRILFAVLVLLFPTFLVGCPAKNIEATGGQQAPPEIAAQNAKRDAEYAAQMKKQAENPTPQPESAKP